MSEHLSTDPYKGVRDFYPRDWAKMSAMFARIRATLALWGYEEYNASPLERAEIYESKGSEEIVHEQTYTFTDRGDRRVTLRPEMTPTLARMVAAKRRELAYPLRWFSIPNVFRYERPQRGRVREHYQLNVDIVGLPEGEADGEIIRIASEILKAFGVSESDFIIRVNSRTLLNAACEAAGLKGERVQHYMRFLDRKAKLTPEAFAAAAGVLSDQDPLTIIDNAENMPAVLQEKNKLLARIASLNEAGVGNVVFDPHITRGFDYYTGIVFEVFDTNPANPRSLFGGGRYDGLVTLFGEDSIPAVGFGMGDVTLQDFFDIHNISISSDGMSPQLYIGTPAVDALPAAQHLALTLRREGVRAFVNLTDRSLGDQIKEAVKRGIPYFVAFGADEVESGNVRLKKLASGEESAVRTSELTLHIAA
jgi:histidyl-tRNA synthetase